MRANAMNEHQAEASRVIRDMLESEFASLAVAPLTHGGVGLEVAAANQDVGAMQIQIDPDEVTIFVGPVHCHFSEDSEEPAAEHLRAAARYIRDVLSDRVVLWSCLGAAGSYAADPPRRFRLPWLVRRFVWSGPLSRGSARPDQRA